MLGLSLFSGRSISLHRYFSSFLLFQSAVKASFNCLLTFISRRCVRRCQYFLNFVSRDRVMFIFIYTYIFFPFSFLYKCVFLCACLFVCEFLLSVFFCSLIRFSVYLSVFRVYLCICLCVYVYVIFSRSRDAGGANEAPGVRHPRN